MIEPLGSVTALQAETYKPQQIQQGQTQTADNTDVVNIESAPKVDAVTKAVETLEDKNEEDLSRDQNQPSPEQLRKAVEGMNRKITTNNSELQFGIHEGTHRVTIKVIDKQSKKVIRELPPEKTLDMIAKAWEIAGILVDEKR